MNQNNYIPQPIDTKGVVLPNELNALAEEIAKNVHEVWAEGRMKEGWTFGEERDDAKKHHPCLVPYEELTDTEKEYDRNTSRETLKLIMKLGFRIVKDK
ncbi:MAG: RyR domain-containing protein [Prevotellaceae bacterium]|nr:RyR domain-containing protein [Prevotellaceae bacterium]